MANIHSSSKVGFGRKVAFKLAQSKLLGKLVEKYPKLIDRISKKSMNLGRERNGDVPWTPLKRPIEESRVALITTGGIILKSQPAFDLNDSKGDCSYREIPSDTPPSETVISHLFYDHSDVKVDLEIMFPLATLHRLQREGKVGSIAPRHFSFQGGIHDPTPLVEKTAPEVARSLVNDQVELAILTPA
ncbi:glycine/sarcosine/betaine reductase selenoprotein B family protein [Neobacillus sp. SCS-31]|uniref:glycine/sarcosine/betaine reductase selenoprotein B family protein n=1 Tax=Neobacillus oceani TaxID=3115292 RepID=UPI003906A3BF